MKNYLFSSLLVAGSLLSGSTTRAQVTLPALPGMILWLDASDVNNGSSNPADGTLVSTWFDKSGNHNNAVTFPGQSSGKVYASQINGQPVVRFTRTAVQSGSVYEVGNIDIRAVTNPTLTIFTVYRQGAQSGDQALWGDDDGVWDRIFFNSFPSYVPVSTGALSAGISHSVYQVPNAGLPGITRLLTVAWNWQVANGSSLYFNGPIVTKFIDQTDDTRAQTDFRIGWDGDGNCYNGDMAEMLMYNRVLTDCEIQQVNRYLGLKYGMDFSTIRVTASGSTVIPSNGSVTLSTTATGSAYQWLLNNVPIAGATAASYSATSSGNYRVAVLNTCADTSAATVVSTTLPVKLSAFTVSQVADHVVLNWSTSDEINTGQFFIERSLNGTDFQTIATVQAAGSSSALQRYAASDHAPSKGANFYRLKQADRDGNFTYSAVQQVFFSEGKAFTVLYPSPATDHFIIESNDAGIRGSSAIIADLQGRIVKRFVVSGSRQQVNIASLPKGIYQVKLSNRSVFRVVKE